nr:retrotransposon protein, putative, Ty1-copia subclass [Tanacetum cinerariifolium]
MFVIEQPIPPAPAANSTANVLAEWNAVYDAYNEVACLMLGSMTPELHRQFENYSPYEMLQELKSMFEKQARVERDFAEFVRNYNMHNMEKTIGELHAMLIEYEKGLPKKAKTSQVMAIRSGKIQKANNKSLKAKGKDKANGKVKDKQIYIPKPKNPKPTAKEYPAKDDTCHHYKDVGHSKRNCLVYLSELLKKKKQVGTSSSLGKMTRKPFPHHTERATDLLGIIHTDVCGLLRHVSRKCANYFITFTNDYSRYPKEIMGYYFYFPPENKFDVTRYAKFFEKNLITQEVSGRVIDLEEIQDEDTSPSKITSEISMEVEGFEPPQEEVIPICRPERTHRALNCLCLNTDMDGIIHTYKARLVENGYTQLYEVDYEEMFSLVADVRAIRILIAIATFYDYEIWQMDVKIAFLNGDIDEDIYMVQPKYFVDPKHLRKVFKLQISIYGLKQASRSWNKRFDEEIKKFGFDQNLDELCVYQKARKSNVTFLILYIDDIIIMGNHILSLQSVKDYLGKCFTMKDLGEAAFIFRIKIYKDRSKRLIRLNQSAYIDKILKRYRMDNSKSGHILMQERLDLNKTQGALIPEEVKRMQNVPYASAVGYIIYKQSTTAMSAIEAEYIAASESAMEAVWIRKFISGLGEINLLKVRTDDNLFDPFTKALPKEKATQHTRSIGLR